MESLFQLFSSPLQVLEFALKHYFRVEPSIPVEPYLKIVRQKPFYFREKIARSCQFPEILDALAQDPDPLVKASASDSDYWQLLGQYKSLLQLSAKEKMDFISRESFPNLLVFIVFDKDPEVLNQVFYHPDVSLPMLHLIRTYFKKRGTGAADRRIWQQLNQVIEQRKNRVYSIKQFFGNGPAKLLPADLASLMENLSADDSIIVEATFQKLRLIHPDDFQRLFPNVDILLKEFNRDEFKTWKILDKFLLLLSTRQHHGADVSTETTLKTKQTLAELKIELLDHCSEDLSDRNKLRTVVAAHMDTSRELREKASGIITLKEILFLIQDDNFPQGTGREIIRILKNHPSPGIQAVLEKIFVQMSGRIRKQLREMEASIKAYCDIIFDSDYFSRLQQARQIQKLLKTAQGLAIKLFQLESVYKTADAHRVVEALQESLNYFEKEFSTSGLLANEKEKFQLQDRMEMVTALLNLPREIVKNEGFTAESDGINYLNNLEKARLLWRSILGQYLGRFKELDEIIRLKWLSALESELSRTEAEGYLVRALNQLESDYKSQVHCNLKIACKECQKRNCAAERFLRQNEFLISELLDYLNSERVEVETTL